MEFEHKIDFVPAYHIGKGNRTAVHGVNIHFVVIRRNRAISLTLHTNWMLPKTIEWWESRGIPKPDSDPTPADLSYHSPVRLKEYDYERGDCEYTGRPCFTNGSGSASRRYFNVFVEHGIDAMWLEMEKYWRSIFEGENDGM